jgi:hypothetical protein
MTTTDELTCQELARRLDATDDDVPEWFRAAQPVWRVGDRVRVVERECLNGWCMKQWRQEVGAATVGRIMTTMRDAWGSDHEDGHNYFVARPDAEGRYYGSWFAAIELEPAPEVPPAGGAGEGES